MPKRIVLQRKARASAAGACIGFADHAAWAIAVTAASDGTLLDRRRIALLDAQLPAMPYHHAAHALPADAAVRLVDEVRNSAERHARLRLDEVAQSVPARIDGVAIRKCPPLPPTVLERLADYRAQNVADTVMYRMALAGAAEARGWRVVWYETKTVAEAARAALGIPDIDAYFRGIREAFGPPWRVDHRHALAAAIVAASGRAGA